MRTLSLFTYFFVGCGLFGNVSAILKEITDLINGKDCDPDCSGLEACIGDCGSHGKMLCSACKVLGKTCKDAKCGSLTKEITDVLNDKSCDPACTESQVCFGDCGIKGKILCSACTTFKLSCTNTKCQALVDVGNNNNNNPSEATTSNTDNGQAGSKGDNNAQHRNTPSYAILMLCGAIVGAVMLKLFG